MPGPRELTPGWARVGLITWVAVFLANIAVAITSRTVGKPPWWLGPSVDPAPIVMIAVPIALIVMPGVLFLRTHRRAPLAGLVCAGALVVVGLADIGATPGVAVVEIVVAVAGAMGSLAANAGVFERA